MKSPKIKGSQRGGFIKHRRLKGTLKRLNRKGSIDTSIDRSTDKSPEAYLVSHLSNSSWEPQEAYTMSLSVRILKQE